MGVRGELIEKDLEDFLKNPRDVLIFERLKLPRDMAGPVELRKLYSTTIK